MRAAVRANLGVQIDDSSVSIRTGVHAVMNWKRSQESLKTGRLLLELQQHLGEDIVIQRLPHVAPGGGRTVQIAGVRWREAKVAVQSWVARRTAAKGIC